MVRVAEPEESPMAYSLETYVNEKWVVALRTASYPNFEFNIFDQDPLPVRVRDLAKDSTIYKNPACKSVPVQVRPYGVERPITFPPIPETTPAIEARSLPPKPQGVYPPFHRI